MSQQNPPTAPPQYSPDGRWWWDGSQWVPVPRPGARRSRVIALLFVGLAAVVAVVVVGLFLLANRPIGSQVEMDGDLDESYCQMFPEDCR